MFVEPHRSVSVDCSVAVVPDKTPLKSPSPATLTQPVFGPTTALKDTLVTALAVETVPVNVPACPQLNPLVCHVPENCAPVCPLAIQDILHPPEVPPPENIWAPVQAPFMFGKADADTLIVFVPDVWLAFTVIVPP